MRKVTKGCLITALVFFVLSIGCFVAAGIVGGNPFKYVKDFIRNGGWKGYEHYGADFDKGYDLEDFELLEEYDGNDVEHLSMNIGRGAVVVREAAGDSCKVWLDEDSDADDLEISMDNNILRIQDSTYHKSGKVNISFWGFNVMDWVPTLDSVHVIIELPKKEYESITGDIQIGALKIYDLQAKTLNIQVEAGVTYGEGVWESDNVELAVDMGSIVIEDMTADKCSMDVEMGEIHAESAKANTLTANVNMGSLLFDRVHAADLTADCDMGSIDMRLVGKREDYFITHETDMGSIDIEGGKKKRYSDAPNEVDLNCDMGSIDVSFLNEEPEQNDVNNEL